MKQKPKGETKTKMFRELYIEKADITYVENRTEIVPNELY